MAISFTKFCAIPLMLTMCSTIFRSGSSSVFHYPAVFNFGDSNSDTGELLAGKGFRLPLPYGETYFQSPSSGRFCNGRLIIDFLMEAMGKPHLRAYLESVGRPSFRKGCNYAAGGSTVLPATAASVSPFAFGVQLNQFLHFKDRVLRLRAKGQNDLTAAFYSKTPLDQAIPTILTEFQTGIQLDEFGCLISHNQAANLFNSQLHALCKTLQSQYADATVTYVDIYAIKFNLVANYSQLGFEQPIMTCCGYGGPPLNYDNRITCGLTKTLDGKVVTAKGCNDSSKYVNWDGTHYTEAANEYVSSQILTGKYSDPPFSLDHKRPFFLNSAVFDYPAVFNFGDSNSDTGDLVAGKGFSLMDAMDMPYLNPYLDSVGAPSFRKGCNYAAAGSTILPAAATAVSPFSLGVQLNQFLHFKARVLELRAGLYMFDIGQNDLAGAFYSKTLDQILASVPTILAEFENGIQNVAKFGTDPSKLDEFGCVTSHNQAAKLFNLQLHALCKKLQGQYTDGTVTYVDIYSIKSNLIANYSRLGFEQPIMACCGYGGPPLNYDRDIGCGQTKTLNGTTVTGKGCDNSSKYINWDGIHYSEAANQFASSQILTGKYSDPPFDNKLALPLEFKF
ncbi:GDSL esterase/lipase, partial [Cucurbita argyrosperma subsp. argyrosperma]